MLENLATAPTDAHPDVRPLPLDTLLGAPRATILGYLHDHDGARIADLAAELGVSETATRRHLTCLEEDGFVTSSSVADGPGRPALVFRLSARGRELFPQRYAATAEELLTFLQHEYGDDGMARYLDWRRDQQAARLGADLSDTTTLDRRLHQLADALSEAGYAAEVTSHGDGSLELTQRHCTIAKLAEEHPELCTSEAQAFAALLGRDVAVSRRLTIAGGHDACVCTVTPTTSHTSATNGNEEPR